MFVLLLLLLLFSPRFILFLQWLFNNGRWDLVFNNSFWMPLLGFLFLPWTTLAYFLVYNPVQGYLAGWDWFWIILAVIVDLGSYGSTRYRRSVAA